MPQRFPIYSPRNKLGKRWSFAYYRDEAIRAESAKGFGGYLGRDYQAEQDRIQDQEEREEREEREEEA